MFGNKSKFHFQLKFIKIFFKNNSKKTKKLNIIYNTYYNKIIININNFTNFAKDY